MREYVTYLAYIPGAFFCLSGLLMLFRGIGLFASMAKADAEESPRFLQVVVARSFGSILIGVQLISLVYFRGDIEAGPFWLWPIFSGLTLILFAKYRARLGRG